MQHAPRHTRVHVSRPRRGKVKGVPRLLLVRHHPFSETAGVTTKTAPRSIHPSPVATLAFPSIRTIRTFFDSSRMLPGAEGTATRAARSNRPRPVFLAPVRAAAGGTPGSRRTAREPATSGGGGVTASASAHFRLLARIGRARPAVHSRALGLGVGGRSHSALVSVGLKCPPPTWT